MGAVCIPLEKMDISQSALSHHMKILCESGIVIGRKEGKCTHYSVSEEGSRKEWIMEPVFCNNKGK